MLKTVIVSPPAHDSIYCPNPLLGPSILKSFLDSKGYRIDLVDLSIRVRYLNRYPMKKPFNLEPFWNKEILIDFLEKGENNLVKREVEKMIRLGDLTSYDVIGFSLYGSVNLPISLSIAKVLKEEYDKKIVFGGPMITRADCGFILDFDFVDFLVAGDGEEPLLALLRYFENGSKDDIKKHDGIWYKEDGNMHMNSPSVFPLEEKSLPSFNLKDFELYKKLSVKNFGILPYLLTRGCKFKCAFCNETKGVGFNYVPLEKAISEVEILVKTYKLDSIYFSQTDINNDSDYIRSFSEKIIEKGLNFMWGGNASVLGLNEKTIKTMSKAGCKHLWIGVETASERLRNRMNIRKIGDLGEFKETLKLLHTYGIDVHAYYMVGLPHEEYEDFEKTRNFIKETAKYTTTASVNVFYLKEKSLMHMNPNAFGIKIRKTPKGKYRFLDKDCKYMEEEFDEIEGLKMEDRRKVYGARRKVLGRTIARQIELKLALRLIRKYPLYFVKKMISHPYSNYDENLL